MPMTKKHYVAIATAIRQTGLADPLRAELVENVASALESVDTRGSFDRTMFIAYATATGLD